MDNLKSDLPSVFLLLADLVKQVNENQQAILKRLNSMKPNARVQVEYITAKEFMEVLCIKRSKFNELRNQKAIKTVEKGRKTQLF